jgi:hypothetical protein
MVLIGIACFVSFLMIVTSIALDLLIGVCVTWEARCRLAIVIVYVCPVIRQCQCYVRAQKGTCIFFASPITDVLTTFTNEHGIHKYILFNLDYITLTFLFWNWPILPYFTNKQIWNLLQMDKFWHISQRKIWHKVGHFLVWKTRVYPQFLLGLSLFNFKASE